MPEIDGALNQGDQNASKRGLHLEDLVPYHALDVVEFEQARCHRTSTRKAGALSPAEPVVDQRAQAREAVLMGHRRLQDMLRRELGHVIQQLDLNGFFGAEVGEQSTL